MADKFYTQDAALSGRVTYSLNMPATQWFIRQVADLLRDITLPDRWVAKGAVTIEQALEAGTEMYLGFAPMIGQIFPYITSNPPDNCLVCDGSMYQRVDYPILFDVIDTAFKVDDNTFITPDLRGRTVIGASTDYAVGDGGGEKNHTLTVAELPSHGHSDTGHSHTTGNSATAVAVTPGELPVLIPNILPAVTGSASANITNTGSGNAHNNMQPYIALKYCVVAR